DRGPNAPTLEEELTIVGAGTGLEMLVLNGGRCGHGVRSVEFEPSHHSTRTAQVVVPSRSARPPERRGGARPRVPVQAELSAGRVQAPHDQGAPRAESMARTAPTHHTQLRLGHIGHQGSRSATATRPIPRPSMTTGTSSPG